MKPIRGLFSSLILLGIAFTAMGDDVQEARTFLLERGIQKIAFVKRYTYTATNFYTEHVNSLFQPGGNICVLDLETGTVQELCPKLSSGVFERMDVGFDADRIVFAWKAAPDEGYRLYEVHADGTNLRRVLPPPGNESRLIKRYRSIFHHGTDDMSPCYLPDGGICFVSTRCQHGLPCDATHFLTGAVLYRCDANGDHLQKLSSSAASEFSPVCMSDGRILYTRWEYVDKGSVAVNALWAMHPDGTFSSEIFGNHIGLPPTFLHGRDIPEEPGRFVFTTGPHSHHTAMGAVVRIDINKNIRTREPMESLTPYVDILGEYGWEFSDSHGTRQSDPEGRGPLFKEAFPISKDHFLVAHKPQGEPCNSPNGYGLYLLDAKGTVKLIYRDPEISCWNPIPLRPRSTPPILPSVCDPELASRNLAQCIVTDVERGMEGIEPGSVKYLRVLEQVPRPWSARRPDFDDEYDQQHAVISRGTHLILKVQHGIVPVAEDGSANFLVPADANIFLQALDENYMALQTERTYVNYRPGEVRSCTGCHAKSTDTPRNRAKPLLALTSEPRLPGPQPGESTGQRPLDYMNDIQPIWDRHCVGCHSSHFSEGDLVLSGELTTLFCESYENLVPLPALPEGEEDLELVGKLIRENYPKTGHAEYLPPKSLGSHTSLLVGLLSGGTILPDDPEKRTRVSELMESHKEVRLTPEELIRVTNWVDTNCQYYGSYFGRRHIRFQQRRDFRPVATFRDATGRRELPLDLPDAR